MSLSKRFAAGVIAAAALLSSGTFGAVTASAAELPKVDTSQISGSAYYVDCSRTSNGDGTEASPLNSLEAANAVDLAAGDALLFKAGTTCEAAVQTIDGAQVKAGLRIVGATGTAEAPITIGAYGEGDAPILAGNGVSETIALINSEYITVTGLEITNTDADSANYEKYMRRGIAVMNDNAGVLHNITITNNDIHDIYGQAAKDLGGSGAVQLETYGQSIPTVGPDKTKNSVTQQAGRDGITKSWFDGVRVTDNTIENVTRSGINMSTDWRCREDVSWDCPSPNDSNVWTPNKNIYIASNSLKHIGGDGIVIQMSDGALVEKNYVYSSSEQTSAGSNAAIWNWNADNTVFQYNEVANTQRASINNDGTAWDFDYGTRNTIFQYNYSHDNAGGALLVCNCSGNTAITSGATYRYNLSVNDGQASEPLSFNKDTNRSMFMANVTDMNFYNNTFILPDKQNVQFSTNGDAGSINFANNLIIASGTITDENEKMVTAQRHMTYANNVFVGSDSASGNWPQTDDSYGNQIVSLADYTSASGIDLAAVRKGDLSSLNNASDYTKAKGRAFGSEGLPFDVSNTALTEAANTTVGFPESFDSATHTYGTQNAVPSWSAPDVGAYQSAGANVAKPSVTSLAGGKSATVTVPGSQTIAVTATVAEGAQLAVSIDNDRDYVQKTTAAGEQTLYVRTGIDSSALVLENLGDGDITGISFATVSDNMRDGSFESANSKGGAKKSASPWTLGNEDNTKNFDTTKITENPRSTINQKDAVVSGEYAAELGTYSSPFRTVTINQRTLPAQPGKTYRLGFWATLGKSGDDTPSTLKVQVKAHPSSTGAGGSFSQYTKTILAESVDAADANGGKVYYSGTFIVPLDVDPYSALWVSIGQPDLASGSKAYIDNVTMVEVEGAESDVASIAVTARPTKTQYAAGENLDETGLEVTATLVDGTTRVLDPTEYTLLGFDAKTTGRQKVTVALNADPTKTATLTVSVVENLAMTSTTDQSMAQTEWVSSPLDASLTCDGKLSTSWSNWTAHDPDTDAWLSYTFNEKHALGSLTLYPDQAGEAVPSQFAVEYLDDNGAWATTNIVGTADADTPANPITVDLSSLPATKGIRLRLTQTGYDKDGYGPYSKVAEVIILAQAPTVTSINVKTAPTKTEYTVGDEFDPTGLVVGATLSDGTTDELGDDEYTLSGFDSSTAGKRTITVTLTDDPTVTTTFTVTVAEAPVVDTAAPVISGTDGLVLDYGADFDPRAGVTATDDVDGDLTAAIVVSGDTVDTTKPGTYTVIYTVSDAAGNTTSVNRVVEVREQSEEPGPEQPGTPDTDDNTTDDGKPTDQLTDTGAEITAIAVAGIMLLAAGLGIVAVRRRER